MPTRNVIFTARALSDLDAIHDYIAADSPENAAKLVRRLFDGARSLNELPDRHPAAREARYFKRRLLQFVIRPYRIVYEVEETVVNIITIRHGRRRPLKPADE